jgi:lysozyme
MLKGIDISSYQGDVDFAAVKSSGDVSFIYAKATEGALFVDDHFERYHDGCKAAGIPFGAYHFLRFDLDPAMQAAHFAATINGRSGELAPMIDVEQSNGATELSVRLSAFLAALKPLIAVQPIIYTSYGFWNGEMQGTDGFSGHRLWVAEYNNDPAPTLPNGWKSWVIWQHSSAGAIPGIAGNVDLDTLNGDDLKLIS